MTVLNNTFFTKQAASNWPVCADSWLYSMKPYVYTWKTINDSHEDNDDSSSDKCRRSTSQSSVEHFCVQPLLDIEGEKEQADR